MNAMLFGVTVTLLVLATVTSVFLFLAYRRQILKNGQISRQNFNLTAKLMQAQGWGHALMLTNNQQRRILSSTIDAIRTFSRPQIIRQPTIWERTAGNDPLAESSSSKIVSIDKAKMPQIKIPVDQLPTRQVKAIKVAK